MRGLQEFVVQPQPVMNQPARVVGPQDLFRLGKSAPGKISQKVTCSATTAHNQLNCASTFQLVSSICPHKPQVVSYGQKTALSSINGVNGVRYHYKFR
jgi:hypothetical protein